jgi:hypothetical protein
VTNGKAPLNQTGLQVTELSTHLQGQLVAVHPAYNELFDGFAPKSVKGNPKERTAWAVDQLKNAAKASKNLGLNAHATFSGALMWHTVYPWPQRPAGLVDDGFKELAKRWLPILNAFDKAGVDLCYEIHPGKTFMTALPLKGSGKLPENTAAAIFYMTQVTSFCSNWIIFSTSIFITSLLKCSM